jgi:hypothetical protein
MPLPTKDRILKGARTIRSSKFKSWCISTQLRRRNTSKVRAHSSKVRAHYLSGSTNLASIMRRCMDTFCYHSWICLSDCGPVSLTSSNAVYSREYSSPQMICIEYLVCCGISRGLSRRWLKSGAWNILHEWFRGKLLLMPQWSGISEL